MQTLLKILAVVLFVGEGLASPIEVEKRDNVTLKAPIVATPSEHWYVLCILPQIRTD
jgi:hypothetical protein